MRLPVIRNIELLVHPFYFFDRFYFKKFRKHENIPTIREKESRILLKHLKRIYSSILLRVKANSKSIMVLTDMKFGKKFVQEQFDELKEFATRELGERLVMVSQDVHLKWSEEDLKKLTRNPSFKLARMLAITASGEYGDQCVQSALNNLHLKLAKKFFIISAEIMKNQGITHSGEGDRLEHFAKKGKIKKERAVIEQSKKKPWFRGIFRE